MVDPIVEVSRPVRSRYRYMVGVMQALRGLSGEASVNAVYEWLIARGIADSVDLNTRQKDGGTRFQKEVRWARKELFDAGYLVSSSPGRWRVTAKGEFAELTTEAAQAIVRENTRTRLGRARGASSGSSASHDWQPAGAGWGPSSGPTTGPKPTDWSGEVSRSTTEATWVYVLRFGARDVWKIGQAGDVDSRLAEINRHVPVESLGEAWTVVAASQWPDASKAYAAEQGILAALQAHRTIGERVACAEQTIRLVWEARPKRVRR